MKLSKKNRARQRAIQKTIASGKALGGLLVGLTAATVVGGCKESSPSRTMGSYPRPQQQANATNENTGVFVTEGAIAVPKTTTPPPMPNAVWEQPNAVWEQRGETITTMGIMPARGTVPPTPPLPVGLYRVKYGDTFAKIAKAHGTTVAELKGLNGFDDVRANNLIMGEVIKVPSPSPNAVNEDRSRTRSVKGMLLPRRKK